MNEGENCAQAMSAPPRHQAKKVLFGQAADLRLKAERLERLAATLPDLMDPEAEQGLLVLLREAS
jgi:hypothetical protein